MAVERLSGSASLIDVLDRILDRAIVIDAWVRVSRVGIDLVTEKDRVVVASIDVCLNHAEVAAPRGSTAKPARNETDSHEGITQVAPRLARRRR